MKLFTKMFHGFDNYFTQTARSRVRAELLRSSDQMLKDAGFSRTLLESGINAWPWHIPTRTDAQARDTLAERELQSYSDSELSDLGISRSSIPEAVRFGREGIERNSERKAA